MPAKGAQVGWEHKRIVEALGGTHVTDAGIADLKQALPSLRILH